MEPAQGYEKKLASLMQALNTLKQSLSIDLMDLSPITQDTVKSGQVQKFEVCVELTWKTARAFLLDIHGIETTSPKTAIKQLYRINHVDGSDYETLIEMINNRNRLSHIYNQEQFDEIYTRLQVYLDLMQKVVSRFNR